MRGAERVAVLGLWIAAVIPAGAFAAVCEGELAAASAWADATDASQAKFRLVQQACGDTLAPLPQQGPAREARQLSLYAPVREAAQPVPFTTVAPFASVAAAAAPRSEASAPRRAVPARGAAVQRIRALVPAVADAARRWDIDPLLLHAVAHVESRHNPQALSHAGARGVMQVMPATARRFGVADPRRELHEPAVGIEVGAEYLKTLQRRFGNDLPLVLAAYNAGEGAVEKYGRRVPPYPETQNYVRDVMRTYAALRRLAARSAP